MKDYTERKTALTPQEKLRVVVAVLVDGMDQQRVANLMGVNIGRVNEIVQAVRKLLETRNETARPGSDDPGINAGRGDGLSPL
jgi:DNA-directed RNA polymerase specialized sigma24 family protein